MIIFVTRDLLTNLRIQNKQPVVLKFFVCFILKVIMYENAGLADSLCYVNQWDHCTIPIHALEVALKLRQLDTVAFFLKNQDKGKTCWA